MKIIKRKSINVGNIINNALDENIFNSNSYSSFTVIYINDKKTKKRKL